MVYLYKKHKMSHNTKKQFGVWMDTQHATMVGRKGLDTGEFIVLGYKEKEGTDTHSNEKTANNHEITLTQKFFKEIATLMPNIDEIHITGTGQAQEQFMHFLADTAQYKNVVSTESTTNKMSDEKLVEYITEYFN
jgi:stalled ribosome rescue protein Dom34